MSMIFLLMILLHIIDDFVMQPVCLSKLKQKSYWMRDEEGMKHLYHNDYKAALIVHSISWSIMVHLPLILMQLKYSFPYGEFYICSSVLVHSLLHAVTDDFKANRHYINLVTDQLIHFGQLCLVFTLWYLWIYPDIIFKV